MTAITEQFDNSKAKLNELRDDAVRKARELQHNATRSAELLFGRVRDTGLETVYGVGAEALGTAAAVGAKLPLAKDLAQTLESRANDFAQEREKLAVPPIENYDDLNVKQVADALEGLDAWSLVKVREYEKEHKNRKTVFAAVERQM